MLKHILTLLSKLQRTGAKQSSKDGSSAKAKKDRKNKVSEAPKDIYPMW